MKPNTKPRSQYRCVNCGSPAPALYKEYSKSVLKLSKCESCDNIVDKYIEYDPVIIMVDLVLISKEAQRHVLYNTSFQAYWKLLVALVLLETYSVWSQESITNLVIISACRQFGSRNYINNNFTDRYLVKPYSSSTPHFWMRACDKWLHNVRLHYDDTELCIAEKAFYVTFTYITLGILAFTLCIYLLMKIVSKLAENKVLFELLLKAVTLGSLGNLFSLPSLIWGSQDKVVHVLLVFSYTVLSFCSVILVLYETRKLTTIIILFFAYSGKFCTTFIMKHILDITLKFVGTSF